MKQKIIDAEQKKFTEAVTNECVLNAISYCDGLNEVISLIKNRTLDLEVRHILIVPDKYTLDAETRLFENSNGAFDIEVLTFARLFYRICESRDFLSREAAVMLIRGICEEIDLNCYKKSARFFGFSEKIYDTINSLLDSGVDILKVSATNAATEFKLADIKKIFKKYKELTDNKFIDRNGRLALLERQIPQSDFIKKAHFYIANFMEFTAGEKRVIERLSQNALSLIISVANKQPPPITAKTIEVYDCAGTVQSLKATARRIRTAVMGGMRYKDMCIVMSSPSFDEAERIFSEYQIPFYTDYSLPLAEHSLAVFIENVFSLIGKQYRRPDMIEISKNIYSGIPKSDSDIFENFVNEFNIDYLSFKRQLELQKYCSTAQKNSNCNQNLQIRIEAAERVRKTIMDRIFILEKFYKKIATATDFSVFVAKIMEFAYNNGDNGGNTFGAVHASDAKKKIEEVLCLMIKVFADRSYRTSFLHEVFCEGLRSGKIMAIPNLSDSVVIAVPSTFRGHEYKYVFVLGMNEGEIPPPKPVSGLLADCEDEIEGYSLPKENENVIELNHILYAAKDKIFISYDSTCENGIANYLRAFEDTNSQIIIKNSFANENSRLTFFEDTDKLAKDLIVSYSCCKAGAIELLLSGLSFYKNVGHIAQFHSAVYAALKEYGIDKLLSGQQREQKIPCGDLFFQSGNISVTRLQEYFACPYSHFIRYGLIAKPKKRGDLLPVDVGTLLHTVAEFFVKDRTQWDDPCFFSKKILDTILDEQPNVKLKIKSDMLSRLQDEAAALCIILKTHLLKGSFSPLGQEISLKNSSVVKPLVLSAGKINLTLNGSVDYADVSLDRVRIIDYKTGKAELTFQDIYYGRKIQLPLYMQAFIKSGFKASGFFLFPFSKKWSDGEKSHRMRGVFDKAFDNLIALDSELAAGRTSVVIQAKTAQKKTGEIELHGRHDYALTDIEIADLCEYAKSVAECAIAEIYEGNIAARPFKKNKSCVCDYCEFMQICGQKYQNTREAVFIDKTVFSKNDNEDKKNV